ncbi:hypothetical protein GCM10022405_46770 [Gibbsiella dentisursi]|uniref:Uncharacterized protein n=1 Tax=Gibbsiella dentisursi TaxID=796890 RepID=A0ABP7MAU4_9GAMM
MFLKSTLTVVSVFFIFCFDAYSGMNELKECKPKVITVSDLAEGAVSIDWRQQRKKDIQRSNQLAHDAKCHFFIIARPAKNSDNIPVTTPPGFSEQREHPLYKDAVNTWLLLHTKKNFRHIILTNELPGWLSPNYFFFVE